MIFHADVEVGEVEEFYHVCASLQAADCVL